MIVLIAVTEKQVVITDSLNAAPLTGGRNAIFNRVSAPTEMKAEVEVVGLYSDLTLATAGREAHARTHPGRRYVQKVCHLDDRIEDVVIPKCIRCGCDVTDGRSFCPPCGVKHLKECADAGGEGDQLPMVRASHGPAVELLHR